MLKRLRAVKHEIRILAIADGGRRPPHQLGSNIIGVIFRGGSWLDGVIRIHSPKGNLTTALARTIREWNHYPQIRILMVEKTEFLGRKVDIKRLSELIERPIIIVKRGSRRKVGIDSFGVHPEDAHRVVEVCTKDEVTPEPIVVARTIARALDRLFQSHADLNL